MRLKKSKRIEELLFYLSNTNGFVQARELARLLHISEKTVYRMINEINEEKSPPLIISKRGLGYKINLQRNPANNSEKDNEVTINISPVERRNKIMKRLLLVSPLGVKESEMFKEYFVSSNVRTNDERIIKQILNRYSLIFSIKNGYLKIKGSEVNIRGAIKSLIDDREIVDLKEFTGNKDFDSEYDMKFALREIEKIEAKLQTTLPYPYNINLYSHIYILLTRLRKVGNYADIDLKRIKTEDKTNRIFLYKISKEVVEDISKFLKLSVPVSEADTIFEYLVSSRLDNDLTVTNMSKQVSVITNELIILVSQKMGCNFSRIDNELEKHMDPLVKRLKNDIHVNNNLLEQIKMEYTDLFNAIQVASDNIFPKYNLPIPDYNEIGYLTLYFAQAIESQSKKLNVVIMCSTGIGTSELLRIKVKNIFPNFNIIDVTSNHDSNINENNTDLIISTVMVSDKIKVPSVIVSALFTQQDQQSVEKAINKIERKKYES